MKTEEKAALLKQLGDVYQKSLDREDQQTALACLHMKREMLAEHAGTGAGWIHIPDAQPGDWKAHTLSEKASMQSCRSVGGSVNVGWHVLKADFQNHTRSCFTPNCIGSMKLAGSEMTPTADPAVGVPVYAEWVCQKCGCKMTQSVKSYPML